MAVNGGGLLTVNYAKEGFLAAQRQVNVPWQDYAWLPDVVLIPSDPQVTTIDLSADVPIQVARGSVVTDDDGTRQATVLFPQGTQAELVMPDGSTQPITSLSVRATEYSVGPNGPDAMPALLPPTSAYTYCVEISADEAVAKVNGKDVLFNQPVIFYVENFLDFPAGRIVPVGFYDNDRGVWVPYDNGRIIQILTINNGLADLDVDGDGVADTGTAVSDLGITDTEREQLAGLYPPGQSLWRVPIEHLSTCDLNYPIAAPQGAEGPNGGKPNNPGQPQNNSCEGGSSIIEIQNQILGETVPLTQRLIDINLVDWFGIVCGSQHEELRFPRDDWSN